MKYVLLLIFCALVFLVCFLVDRLLQKLFPKHELEKSKSVVRPPQKSATFGVLLVFIPLMALLFWMPEGGDTLLTICCVGAMIMGAFLLYTYFSIAIYSTAPTQLFALSGVVRQSMNAHFGSLMALYIRRISACVHSFSGSDSGSAGISGAEASAGAARTGGAWVSIAGSGCFSQAERLKTSAASRIRTVRFFIIRSPVCVTLRRTVLLRRGPGTT